MNKHNFDTVFEKQKDFSQKFFKEKFGIDIDNASNEDKLKWTKEFILSASKELYEMLDEVPWKKHRFIEQNNNMENFLEEGIDAFKFLLNIFILNGFTPDDIIEKFYAKSEVVEIRYKQENNLQKLKKSKEKVIVIDIDGVLNNYPQNFIEYFQSKGYNYDSISDFKLQDLLTYNKVKHSFRVEGYEANCPLNENVVSTLIKLNKKYKIVLLTARPYEKISRLFSDTLVWIDKNKIICDFVFFAKNKEEWLIQNFQKEQVKFIVDDQIDNVNKLSKYFDNVYLVKNLNLYKEEDFTSINSKISVINHLSEVTV